MQVTRLQCGGFIFGMRLHHAMTDANGLIQFMTAVAEMARGCVAPSVLPIWSRKLFKARIPPRPSFLHRAYDEDVEKEATTNTSLDHDMVHSSFFFGPHQIATLRNNIPPHLRNKASTFDILTACLWKCRTIALSVDPDEEMHMIFAVNARAPKRGLNLPKGYYGNAVAYVAAVSNADDLCQNPLGHPLDLILKAKAEVNCEYMQSVADFMVLQRWPHFKMARSYIVSDLTNAKFEDVDFGWGKAIYGGLADGGAGSNPAVFSVYISFTNAKGEKGITVPVCLLVPTMEKFVIEIEKIIQEPSLPLAIRSTL